MERNEHAVPIFCTAVALGLLAAALGLYWLLPVILIAAILIDGAASR